MIDTYFDRADAATGFKTATSHIALDDQRLYHGLYFATVIDRNVFAARDQLAQAVDADYVEHRLEMHYGIQAGTRRSAFSANGRRK